MLNKIVIKGAKEHNLKNIDLELPKNEFVVVTGVSGSGKSSLVFDTIFAEGQRRYVESLSSYARQFLGQLEKPDVEYIEGLSPAIAIDQKAASHNPRSTVGTVTEIYDYLRLLYAKIGLPHCPKCGKPIKSTSAEEIVDIILDWPEGNTVQIFSPIVRGKKGEYLKMLDDLFREGYTKARLDGKITRLDADGVKLSRYKLHSIEVLVNEFKISTDNISLITEAVEEALKLSKGTVLVRNATKGDERTYNQNLLCPDCEISFPELEPRLFSFNSPFGACPECNGLGAKQEINPELVIPDKEKSVSEGGVMPWNYSQGYYGSMIRSITEELGYSKDRKLKEWDKGDIKYILYGSGESKKIKVKYFTGGGTNTFYLNFDGLINHLQRRYLQTESPAVREQIEKYMTISPCPTCEGTRLKPETLLVRINRKNIAEITGMSVKDVTNWFNDLQLNTREKLIAQKILKEVKNRLNFLSSVGLEYLTLDRQASTLAGGEAQRIRLASQIGSALTGVLYALDEPSIGLHPRDQRRLIDILIKLKDLGNTVIAVEHDLQTMEAADYLVDIGPGAGQKGGEVVAQGSLADIKKARGSLTGQFLSGRRKIEVPKKRRPGKGYFLKVVGATEHNLKNINVDFPLGVMTVVTGVSGSGKSTLVNDILFKGLARILNGSKDFPGKHSSIQGAEYLKSIINIDQSPIGRTPRSNPATYTGLFTPIRELFASTKEAKLRGFGPGRFSFNVYGGRCETCQGDGSLQIEMQFLPDVYIPCDVCHGKRYNRETLQVSYKGKNIAEVLKMSVDEALIFFNNIPRLSDKLKLLSEVGLGYIELGQPATTLSGGEAQRVKLATELAKREHGRNLYILDEPTTGLHFADIEKLLEVLQRLVTAGNTIIIIEHNLDVIKVADWLVDLGPEGGDNGGKVIAKGTPEEIAATQSSFTGQFLKEELKR